MTKNGILGPPALTEYSCEASHPEPPKTVYYWEKTKQGQIPYLNLHNNSICEEGQHFTPRQKSWIFQVLQLE